MTRRWMAALAAGFMMVACGGGSGSLPPGPGGETQDPPGNPDLPGTPVDPNPPGNGGNGGGGGGEPEAPQGLWPLTKDSTWVYDIRDEFGAYQKRVTVLGPQTVPGTNPAMTAVLVHSRQDRTLAGVVYEEYSYQLELTNGLVVRLREEDHKNGDKVRTTTWSPATVKSLARIPESMPWTTRSAVQEMTVLGDGSEEESDPTYDWKVLETGLTVTTRAGTFTNVIKVQRDKLNDRGEVKADKVRVYWLAPGVGKIREEGERTAEGQLRTEELVSFDIKK